MANSAFELTKANQGATLLVVNQTAHGLVVGDWVYINGTDYEKARADASATSVVVGVVVVRPNVDAFTLQMTGNAQGLTGLSSGVVYFLSTTVAGALQTTVPVDPDRIVPLLVAHSTTAGILLSLGEKVGAAAAASKVEHDVNQVAHGFVAGDVIRLDGVSTYAKALADVQANSEVVGVVSFVINVDNFTVQQSGYITGLSGLTANVVEYLSTTVAGATQTTIPTGGSEIIRPVILPDNTTTGFVLPYVGRQVTPVLNHTAQTDGETSLSITTDSNAMGGVNALTLNYIADAVAAGDFDVVNNMNVDVSASTGGIVTANLVNKVDGTANVVALSAGSGVDLLLQNAGDLVDMDSALVNAVDVLTEFTTPGSNVQMFVANSDTVTIGSASQFIGIAFDLAINASGAGVKPTFEYSTGVGTWATFNPNDDTDGFRISGGISWDATDLSTWLIGTGSEFLIRITRTQNNVNTPPTENFVQIAESEFYSWDKTGKASVKRLVVNEMANSLAGQIAIFDSAGVAAPLASQGTSGQVFKSAGSNANPSFEDDTSNLYDIAFNAGFDAVAAPEDLVVQDYAQLVASRTGSFTGEAGYLDVVATGAVVIVDIEKNGTTIYATKPQFAISANALTAGVLKTDGTEDFIPGDRITFSVTQVGSTIVGQGLRFTTTGDV